MNEALIAKFEEEEFVAALNSISDLKALEDQMGCRPFFIGDFGMPST